MNNKIFQSLFEIVTFFNRPQQDKRLLTKAGLDIDTALFPIIVRIGLQRSISVGELANQMGRSHSTVSRQIDKLEAENLVRSDAAKKDGRVREITLSDPGTAIFKKISQARREAMNEVLSEWDEASLIELQANLQHLAQSLRNVD
jgi:DNA-binding MarR family transcriptional regulator